MKFLPVFRRRAARERAVPAQQVADEEISKKSVLPDRMRMQLYGQLEVFLKSAAQLDQALDEMYKVYSENGKRPRDRRALVVREILAYMGEGFSFAIGISRFIPESEYFLLMAGERSGALPGAMRQCVRLIKAGRRISSARREAYAYNAFLLIIVVACLLTTAYLLVPLAMLWMKGAQLTGLGRLLYLLSEAVVYAGLPLLAISAAALWGFKWSKGHYIGPGRVWFDRHWPYATHRMMQGTTFLISLSALTSANVSTGDALDLLAEHASAYMRQRLVATRRAYDDGSGLGEALQATGYEFPDRDAIVHLRILGSRAGVETAITEFADDWLATSLERIEASAKISRIMGIVAVALLAIFIILGSNDMQQQARSALGV
ncbi:type II secretion system F family protein [Castellaniella sp. UC4442_H9]